MYNMHMNDTKVEYDPASDIWTITIPEKLYKSDHSRVRIISPTGVSKKFLIFEKPESFILNKNMQHDYCNGFLEDYQESEIAIALHLE